MDLEQLTGLTIYPRSIAQENGAAYCLARSTASGERFLGVQGRAAGFEGEQQADTMLCPLTSVNAVALRARLPWLRPRQLGLQTSAGFGDRLGLATPGHAWAARRFSEIAPIFAQQSVRENARTGRTPQQVLDDAVWGLFQEGWREPWGADADHLKTPADVDAFVAVGYTFYTIDPGDHVDNDAHTASLEALKDKIHALPWDELEDTPERLHERYLDRRFEVEDFVLEFDRMTLARAAAKYGRAVAHTVRMHRYLVGQMGEGGFELEVSVDETETPTSPEEHFFIASELRRLGVKWVSLAPRYVGRFEKGVDYVGTSSSRTCSARDLDEFKLELARHAAIARACGPYKLSIHSGSDKFSIYPIIAELTQGLVHVKTAGTSYLEALRAVAQVAPSLFREILTFARARYETDRASYHVSAQLDSMPVQEALSDADLSDLLDQFDARQVLHVTFGSVLDRFGDRLLATLREREEVYYELLESHFNRHLSPFAESLTRRKEEITPWLNR
jgi:hypothetical protein